MPTFILGAGFNADATAEAGPLFAEGLYRGRYQIDCSYPLVNDTIQLCFGPKTTCASVEHLFSEALERGDYEPIRKLAERLRYADFRIANALASDENANSYQTFFRAFSDSKFLTFNYDSLPETLLFRQGCWYPRDGYGLEVRASLGPSAGEYANKKSVALVLHLHGSLSIRTSEYEIQRERGHETPLLTELDEPLYGFDPSSISGTFAPFNRDVGADDVEDRIIAPVPDKSSGLNQAFIRETYTNALFLARNSDVIIAIGYSFNPHDRASYQPLLHALEESNGRRLVVVSPDAEAVASTLRQNFPALRIEPLVSTFKQWVEASFPGLGLVLREPFASGLATQHPQR
jgi:hypothetical protein